MNRMKVVGSSALFLLCASMSGALAQSDQEEFLPIELKCPADNGGVLDYFKRNGEGTQSHLTYNVKQATVIIAAVKLVHENKWETKRIDLTTASGDDKDYWLKVRHTADLLMKDVCLASQTKRHSYFVALKANRKKLGLN